MNKFWALLSIIALSMSISTVFQHYIKGKEHNYTSDVIRIVDNEDKFSNIKEVKNSMKIKRINEILEEIEWSIDIQKPKKEPNYSFWLEHKGSNDRVKNYDIWFDDNFAIIFDKKNGKYGLVNDENVTELKNLLN